MNRLSSMLLAATALTALAGGVAKADITIATAGPMTGQYAAFGEQMRRGAEMAVKDINAKGGVLGQKLVLKIGDDACDPRQAVAVANQFVNDGVVFVAGHFCSGSSIPASAVYHEEGIIQMSPASTNPTLTDQGFDNVFRVCGRDDQQGPYAADYAVEKKLGAKVAIVQDKSAYGKGLADAFKAELNKKGVTEVSYDAVTQGDKDFSALITKLKQEGAEFLYYGGYHTELGLITRQAKAQGLNLKIMSGDAIVTDEYWAITGEQGTGTYMTFSPDPRNIPDAAAVVKEFTASGYNPEGYTLYTYAAVQVFAQAAAKANSPEPDKVMPLLHGNTYTTVIGPVAFDQKGDKTGQNYVMFQWSKDGKYAEVK